MELNASSFIAFYMTVPSFSMFYDDKRRYLGILPTFDRTFDCTLAAFSPNFTTHLGLISCLNLKKNGIKRHGLALI